MQRSTYRLTIVVAFISFALAGCERKQVQTSPQSTVEPTPAGRSETKALRAASVVGYDGKQLQKQVDKVLEQKKNHDKNLENELNDTGP